MGSVFDYTDYRKFLADYLESEGKGAKLRFASIIGCQPGYITQIVSGMTNMSSEQAEKLTAHLGWDTTRVRYFLLLVSHARAGTKSLANHYKHEIDRQRGEAQVLKNRIKPEKVLSIEDQATFYSSWHYGALHVCVSIPGCETESGIAELFDLPMRRVNEIIQFLINTGLVKKSSAGVLSIGSTQVYIGSDSPLISKHHTNWRLRAIESLDRYKENHLHYSSVISISATDVDKIREIMAETIQRIRTIVRASKDEKCFSYGFDLFEVGQI